MDPDGYNLSECDMLQLQLSQVSGSNPSRESTITLLKPAGIRFQQEKLDCFLLAISNNPLHQLISKGFEKIAIAKAAQEQQKPLKNKESPTIFQRKWSLCGSQEHGGELFDCDF